MSVAVGPLTVIAREARSIATDHRADSPRCHRVYARAGKCGPDGGVAADGNDPSTVGEMQKLSVLEVHGAQAPGSLLIIAGAGTWKDGYIFRQSTAIEPGASSCGGLQLPDQRTGPEHTSKGSATTGKIIYSPDARSAGTGAPTLVRSARSAAAEPRSRATELTPLGAFG